MCYNDILVVRDVLDGNIEEFEKLMENYRAQVFSMVAKRVPVNDIESVAQDVFVRVYQSLGAYSQEGSFGAWLSRIAMRTCCDYWRTKGRQIDTVPPAFGDSHNEWLESAGAGFSAKESERLLAKKEAAEILEWTLRRLSPEDRMLVDLVYLEGWQLKEAAKVMEWGLSKTKVRAMRAKMKMRRILKGLLREIE